MRRESNKENHYTSLWLLRKGKRHWDAEHQDWELHFSMQHAERMPLCGGWRTRRAENQGKPCRAKGTELEKSLRRERLWCSYGNEKTDVILVGLSFISFWPLGHTLLKKGAIIECSKGEKGHGAVVVQSGVVTASHQRLNPPEEKSSGISSN